MVRALGAHGQNRSFQADRSIAAPDDPINDATKPWPDGRPVVDLDVVTINKVAANSLEAQKPLLFLPGSLTDRIEPPDDPLIEVRDTPCAVPSSRRIR